MTSLARWPAALLGAAVALSVNGLFGVVIFRGMPLGGPYWTYTSNTMLLLVSTLLPLSAHVVGGLAAGALTRSSPGVVGMSSAALAGLVAVFRMLVAVLSVVLNPDPDAVPLSEEAGFLSALAALFAIYFPLTVLAGYLGGRLGGRRATTR